MDSQCVPTEILPLSPLTIKTHNFSSLPTSDRSLPISPSISISPNFNSPSTISPPSSAFVSALQSPYISPRALDPPPPPPPPPPLLPPPPESNNNTTNSTSTNTTTTTTPTTAPSPASYSDDVPSTSYTPPSERCDLHSTDPSDQKPKFSDASRVSFSFPVPRVSLTRTSVSSSNTNNAKLRSSDVYVGFHGQSQNLVRFCKWLKAELELQGIASFVADRAKYSKTQSHEIADRVICSATFGVVVVTPSSFLNPHSVEEIRFFAQKKNLIPVLFDTDVAEITGLLERDGDGGGDWREAVDGVCRCSDLKLETDESNWRSCVSKTVEILKSKLGRKVVPDREVSMLPEELPFPRNKYFVGREKELVEIESAFFFGCCGETLETTECSKPPATVSNGGSSTRVSDGFADEESDALGDKGRFISLEMRKCKEPTLESWIEPVIESAATAKERDLQKQRSKRRKSKWGSNKQHRNNANAAICLSGTSGTGKTELALEFAYRYCQRYKMVLWVGGESRYFRQNILNISRKLGLDVSAEMEKERGRIKSFEEQEFEAFQRVKRELFRDVPYLLIIDNLESEKEWWEGKDLHDFIPSNTGATNVILTTRLSKVSSFETMQLPSLSLADSLLLLRGKGRKSYVDAELEILKKFDERLGRLAFGLWLIGSLLSELDISPAELFAAVENVALNDTTYYSLNAIDDAFYRNNPFLIKAMVFCFAILEQQMGGSRHNLAHRMALAGVWFSPAPISSHLLAAAADKMAAAKGGSSGGGGSGDFQRWKSSLGMALLCGMDCCAKSQGRRNEVESAIMLVKLGLAKRANRQPGCWIQFHPIAQYFAQRRGGLPSALAAVVGLRKVDDMPRNFNHLWASAFLLFGFKSEPPLVQLKAMDMVHFISKTALPLAIHSFVSFSRCNSALELLKVCTDILEEAEKTFVSQIQDWHGGPLCFKKRVKSSRRVDEYVWRDVTLLKATLLEARAKLLLQGGHFDSGEELCRTCISIRTVMLGHNHPQTLAAQKTLSKLVRFRSKI